MNPNLNEQEFEHEVLGIEELGEHYSQDFPGKRLRETEKALIKRGRSNESRMQKYYEAGFEDDPEGYIEHLASDIKERGFQEPVVLQQSRYKDDHYAVAEGHHRFHAARRAGIETVPVRRWDPEGWPKE